jgi:hypothetical protein
MVSFTRVHIRLVPNESVPVLPPGGRLPSLEWDNDDAVPDFKRLFKEKNMLQSRNQREGAFNGRFAFFKGDARFNRSKTTSLKVRRKEKRDWERKLAAASPEERTALIQSRAYNTMAAQQSSLGDVFFPVKKEKP